MNTALQDLPATAQAATRVGNGSALPGRAIPFAQLSTQQAMSVDQLEHAILQPRPVSPVPGVSFQPQRPVGGRWRAQWQENGSRRNETFSIVTYGDMDRARALAEAKIHALVKEGKGSSFQKAYFTQLSDNSKS